MYDIKEKVFPRKSRRRQQIKSQREGQHLKHLQKLKQTKCKQGVEVGGISHLWSRNYLQLKAAKREKIIFVSVQTMVMSPHSEAGHILSHSQPIWSDCIFVLVFLRKIENMMFGGEECVERLRLIMHLTTRGHLVNNNFIFKCKHLYITIIINKWQKHEISWCNVIFGATPSMHTAYL